MNNSCKKNLNLGDFTKFRSEIIPVKKIRKINKQSNEENSNKIIIQKIVKKTPPDKGIFLNPEYFWCI